MSVVRAIATAGLALAAVTLTARAEEQLPAPEEVRAGLTTVAVIPLPLAESSARNHAEIEQRIEHAIEQRLAAAGIAVIPASVMRDLQDKVRAAIGGYYDPRTGEADEKKADAYRAHVKSEFRRLHPADAWLYPRIERRQAEADNTWYAWDGVRELTTDRGSSMKQMFEEPVAVKVPALSLCVMLARPEGTPLYLKCGGLQVLEHLEVGSSGMTGVNVKYAPVADEGILADPAREARAFSLVLDPLLLTKAQRDAARRGNEASWKTIKQVPKGARPAPPPSVDRAVFLAKYPHVTVAAPVLPGIRNGASVHERYGAALTAALQQSGFQVLPPADYQAAWDSVYAATGGFYDPMTGEFLAEKRKSAIRETMARLNARTPVDAVFLAEIVPSEAHIEDGFAQWDGAKVKLNEQKEFLDMSTTFGGSVGAASLELRAVDRDANEVFLGRGGIELLVRYRGTILPIPPAEWFSNTANDAAAVERALRNLRAAP